MSASLQEGFQPRAMARPAVVWPFFWCVRREIWENKFIFIAPIAVAMLVVGAYLIGTVHLPEIMSSNPQMKGTPPAGLPFYIADGSVVVTGVITGIFYALGALYNERRDRSILFWKSLPISDRTVVLAKAFIPLVILPLLSFVVTLAMALVMLGLAKLFGGNSGSLPQFWTNWPFFQMALVMFYCFVTMVLWQAPLWGWLFAVSAWAKRAPFLWAFLLPLGLCIFEKVAFGSTYISGMITDRIAGSMDASFNALNGYPGIISPNQIAPLKFLSASGLWLGLLVAAGLFLGAIRLRRFHGPL